MRANAYLGLQIKALLNRETNSAEDIYTTLSKVDAWRRPERFYDVLTMLSQIESTALIPKLEEAINAALAISPALFIEQGISGKALGAAIAQARTKAIQTVLRIP